MAVSASQWQRAILQEVGASIADDSACCTKLSTQLPSIWALWADKGETSLRLQYLYAKRQAIDYLLGSLRTQIDTELGPLKKKCSTIFDNLMALRDMVTTDIDDEESRGYAGGRMAIGEMTTTAPIMPGTGELDPHHRYYRGDPLIR